MSLIKDKIVLDRYHIEELIKSGGQAQIYKAFDFRLKNIVCIKAYPSQDKESFEIEKEILSYRLSPNIPNIIDSGSVNSNNIIVMDFISGKNLREYLSNTPRGSLPVDNIKKICIRILENIEALHDHQKTIIYGDFKPDNFIRTPEGLIYTVDFGASSFHNNGQHGLKPRSMGTPGYAAPEQSGGNSIRSDIYGLGCLMFFLLSGDDPPVIFDDRVIEKNIPANYRIFKPIISYLTSSYQKRPDNIARVKQLLISLKDSNCVKCGAEITPGKRYCKNCGELVGSMDSTRKLVINTGKLKPGIDSGSTGRNPIKIISSVTKVRPSPDVIHSRTKLPPSLAILPQPAVRKQKIIETPTFKKLLKRDFSPSCWFDLRIQAEEIFQVKGFEKLLCLPEVEIDHHDFQLQNVNTALNNMSGNVILADEVGLGKTIQGCLMVKELIKRGLAKRILIIVPPALVYQWHRELDQKFNEQFSVFDSSTGWHPKKLIVSLHTARMRKNIQTLENYHYDVVIVDEANCLSHKSGNQGSLWDVVYSLQKKYLILITATPFRYHLSELYNMVTLVRPGQFLDYNSFSSRFISPWDSSRAVNTTELKRALDEVMIRTRRRDVWGGAERKRHVFNVTIKSESNTSDYYWKSIQACKYLYHYAVKQGVQSLDSSRSAAIGTPLTSDYPPENFLENKLTALEDILKKNPSDKIIVFSMIKDTLVYLRDQLYRSNRRIFLYQGDRWRKEKTVVDFLNSSNGILLADETASKGRNLQKAHILVNYDIPWNPSDLEQRMGRVSRMGQKKEIFIYNMVTENTAQEMILDLYTDKLDMFRLVVGELSSMLSDREEIDFESSFAETVKNSGSIADMRDKFMRLGNELTKTRNEFLSGSAKGSSGIDEILFGEDSSSGNEGMEAEIRKLYYQ